MRYNFTSFFFLVILLCTGQVFGQIATYNGYTVLAGTDAEHNETLLLGPGDYIIDGTWEIYSKYVWIDPNANITGNGTMVFYQTNTAVTPEVTPGPTYIDANNVTIDVNIELHNNLNLVLADITVDGLNPMWSDSPGNASLGVGRDFSFEEDGADVVTGLVLTDPASDYVDIENTASTVTNLIFDADATVSNFGPDRMVVTSNSIGGHMVKTGVFGSFIFPVGIAEGDYTPAELSSAMAEDSVFVSVQDYASSGVDEGVGPEGNGIDRTWHIYSTQGTGSWTVNLQHNTATEQPDFESTNHYVTRWDGSEWTNDMLGPGTPGTLTDPQAADMGTSMRSGTFSALSADGTAGTYFTKSSVESAPDDPVNCVAVISPSIGPDGTITLQLEEVIPGNRNMPIYTVEALNEWGGVIWKGTYMLGTDLILDGFNVCDLQGLKITLRITNGEETCYSTLIFDHSIDLSLVSAFGTTVTDASDVDVPTAYIDTGLLVTYCGYVPDPSLHKPQVVNPCNLGGTGRYEIQAQPDWIMPVSCSEDSDTAEIIFRTWEVFNKEGDLFTLTDTIVVLRLPQLTSASFVGSNEDSVYCTLDPNLLGGEADKRYSSWKQPVGLHDYERPNAQLRGVVYEIPLTIIIAGYLAAEAQGPQAVSEYLSCVILRKADGEEVTIADIVSGDYLNDLLGSVSAEQRRYGFLHAIYQLGESPVSIIGGLFTFFPYLLLEEGDWVLSEGGYFEQVTSEWFYTGHLPSDASGQAGGNAPYWFAGGWPFIQGTGGTLWYSDGQPEGADGCAVRVLVPTLEDEAEACVEICLEDLDGNAHCGISIDYGETAWSGTCPQTQGRDITVNQRCWGTTVNECVSDEFIQTNGEEGFIVVNKNITAKMRTFKLTQWRNVLDTIGPIFDFYYPLGACMINGVTGPMGPTGPTGPDMNLQALPLPGDLNEACGDLEWCADDIAASIRAGVQYGSANAWEKCNPTTYRVTAHDCAAEVFVPDVQIIDNCSGIHSVKAIVEVAGGPRMVSLVQTDVDYRIADNGDTSYVYTYSHLTSPIIIPFNGCDGPLTEVRYEAVDHCWNQSEWYKYIRIIDDVPPTVVVDRDVNLSMGSETEWVSAETFDEGSWDNCAWDLMLTRRSDWASLIDICGDGSAPYNNWIDLLDDLGINRSHATQAAGGSSVGTMAMENGFKLDELALFFSEGEMETYYFHQLVWLWEDGASCGRKVVHGWLFALAAYLAENCSEPDDHGNTLDVRDLEYIFDHLFDQPGYGNELSLLGGGWAQDVPFNCDDACLPVLGEQVTAELLVMDACCNWGTGWSTVHVEDKSNPTVIEPLADLEVSCEAYGSFYQEVVEAAAALGENGSANDTSGVFDALDEMFGTYSTVLTDLAFDYFNITCSEESVTDKIADTLHDGTIDWIEAVTKTTVLDTTTQTGKDGIIEFVCNGEVVQDVWLDLDDCGNGTITRRFHITSGCASTAEVPLTLVQVIEVRSACSLRKSMFDLPTDFGSVTSPICLQAPLSRDYFPDALGSAQVKPHLAGVLCNALSIGSDIKELGVQGRPGLKKYEIVWRLLDWCVDGAMDLTHTQVVIARIDGSCDFDGGETSGNPVQGVLEKGERVHRDGFVLYQNQPNPFEGYTVIGFELPEASEARLLIYEVTGKVLKEIKGKFVKGYNEVTISRDELSAGRMLYYQLETDKFVATKKMVVY